MTDIIISSELLKLLQSIGILAGLSAATGVFSYLAYYNRHENVLMYIMIFYAVLFGGLLIIEALYIAGYRFVIQ